MYMCVCVCVCVCVRACESKSIGSKYVFFLFYFILKSVIER